MHRHFPMRLTPAKANKKARLPHSRQPGCLSRNKRPVAFSPHLAAGLVFSINQKQMLKIMSILINYLYKLFSIGDYIMVGGIRINNLHLWGLGPGRLVLSFRPMRDRSIRAQQIEKN